MEESFIVINKYARADFIGSNDFDKFNYLTKHVRHFQQSVGASTAGLGNERVWVSPCVSACGGEGVAVQERWSGCRDSCPLLAGTYAGGKLDAGGVLGKAEKMSRGLMGWKRAGKLLVAFLSVWEVGRISVASG